MGEYKLKQPIRKTQPIQYLALVFFVVAFLIFIVLINPISTGAWRSWGYFSSSTEFAIWTIATFLVAGLMVVLVVRRDALHTYTVSLLWANRAYVTHEEYMQLMGELKFYVWHKGNAGEIQSRLQELVDKHKGKDLRVEEYGLRKEHAEHLANV